jgi:hypothetical protein
VGFLAGVDGRGFSLESGGPSSAKVNEHKEERSLERLVDMEVSRKKD